MRAFTLGAILSVTTGTLLAPSLGEVHELLDYMTGDTLWTHQLPRANAECRPELLRQHPQLADLTVPDLASPQDYLDWVATQATRFGESLEVFPTPKNHTRIDPLSELAMLRPDLSVVVIPIAQSPGVDLP